MYESNHIKKRLQLFNKHPLIITDIRTIKFLQRVNALSRYERIQRVFLLQVAAIKWLIRSLDFDGHGRRTLLGIWDGFVLAFYRCAEDIDVS